MKIQRTIPPAAAPVNFKSLFYGVLGGLFEQKYLRKLEDELKEYLGIKHVFLVSSGKVALATILRSLSSIDNRREVLIPAYTCFSVPSAIINSGLQISLCDIEAETFDFNLQLLKKKINKNTLCVVPSNLFGVPSNIEEINKLCRDNGIYVIEDVAQAMGGQYDGKKLGTIGDVGFFSLGRGKNITSGSGGIIVTNSDKIANAISKQLSTLEYPGFKENINEFIQHLFLAIFIRPSLYWLPAGLPFLQLGKTFFYKDFPLKRLSGMKAGFLRGWQSDLEKSNLVRMENTKFYSKNAISSFPCLRFPLILESMVIRDKICNLSNKRGLGISKMYPRSINEIDEIKDGFNKELYPVAKNIAERLVTLPTHHLLTEVDKNNISNFLIDNVSNYCVNSNSENDIN